MNKKGFSFIEVVIVVTIISLLAVIWVGITSESEENSKNEKVLADLSTVKWNLTSYKAENSTVPLPMGNTNFYNDEGWYMHSESGSYWVSGSIRENILPRKYVNILPVDPRTNQYYAYGKEFAQNGFEVAGVLYDKWNYVSKVMGDYDGKDGIPNLVREYNGANFVFDGATDIYPYNPEKKAMNAKIISFSGSILLNGNALPTGNISSTILVSWDTLNVGTWWLAEIAFSDGSISTLWDSNTSSEVTLAYMDYKNDTFFTKVSLALKIWTLWTQATKLDSKSEFEVSTSDTTASVRGTIFWVSKDAMNSTQVTVTVWKVLVAKILNNQSIEQVVHTLEQNGSLESAPIVVSWVTTSWTENGNPTSYIEVSEWDSQKWIEIQTASGWVVTSSGNISEPLRDTSFTNWIPLKVVDTHRTAGGTLVWVTFKKSRHFLPTDSIIIKTSYSNTWSQIGSFSGETFFVNTQQVYWWGGGNSISFTVCRSDSQCTQTKTLIYQLWNTVGTINATGSLTDTTWDKVCNGIKIRERCMRDELTASGWTLVGAADYTQSDGSLYTYNGGKISGNYDSNIWFSSDGYRPSSVSWSGIVYKNINKFLGDVSYAIEVKVDGYTLSNSTGSQFIFSSNLNSWLGYKCGTSCDNKVVVIPPNNQSPWFSKNIFSQSFYNLLFIQNVDQSPLATINNISWETLTSFSSGTFVHIGENLSLWKRFDNLSTWKWTIKSLKIYKKNSILPTKEVNTVNQISLRKDTPLLPSAVRVNGECWIANGKTYSSTSQIVASELCTHWVADNLIEWSNYTWSCLWTNWGTNRSCSANRQIAQVNWYGCNACLYWYETSDTNREWDTCALWGRWWWWDNNESYCKNIIWTDGLTVRCAEEESWFFSCDWRNSFNWSWTPINITPRNVNIQEELQMEER